MPFTHDIFISYGHLDDLNPFGQDKGWVDLLHERLLVLVGQALGYEPKIWRDGHNLQGNDELTGASVKALRNRCCSFPSSLRVMCSLTGAIAKWKRFMQRTAAHRRPSPGFRSRVFKVVKTPLPEHLKKLEPAHIRNLIGYQFFAEDDATGLLTEFSPDQTDKHYWRMLNRLVADITKTLIELKHSPQQTIAGSSRS